MLKALIVDDEPRVRKGIAKLIDWQALGYVLCGEAEDGGEAYEILCREKCELCITDIRMPEVDGLELIRRVRQNPGLNVKFVILSAYNDFIYAQTAMKHGVKDYILKPIDENALTEVLQRIAGEIRWEQHQEAGYRQGQDAFAGKACIRLVQGDMTAAEAEEAMRLLNLKEKGVYHCILLDVGFGEEYGAADADESRNAVKSAWNAVKNVIGSAFERRVFEVDSNRIGILADDELLKRFEGGIREFAGELQTAVESGRKGRGSVLVGEKAADVLLLKDSFKTAMHAQDCRFVSGNSGVIFYEDIRNVKFHYVIEEHELFKKLDKAVEAGNEKDIGIGVDFIFHYFHSRVIAPECVKASVINFCVELAKRISNRNGDMDEILVKHARLFNFEIRTMTAARLKQLLVAYCQDCSEKLARNSEKSSLGLKRRIEEYVMANFKEDITIKTVASEFYMNPAYLGQVFRKAFGMYFHEYLNSVRMEEAKRLLKRTDFKVYEIAAMVGYTNADYFSSKFEALVGMTPLQYRKNG